MQDYPDALVSVDMKDYEDATLKTKIIYEDVKNKIQSHLYTNLVTSSINSYYFKIVRKDNMNGIFVCLPPYDLQNGYEVYTINNSKKDNNSCIKIKEDSILICHILNKLFLNEINNNVMNKMYHQFLTKMNDPLILNNFLIIKLDMKIMCLNINTYNGYMFMFYIENEKPLIKLNIIQNGKYYKNHKTNYISSSVDIMYNKLLEYINQHIHDIQIKCCKIIKSKYLEDNFVLDNPNVIDYNFNNNYNQHYDPHNDPNQLLDESLDQINDRLNSLINDPN